MNAYSHTSPAPTKLCLLRSAIALVLMTVFAFGQWVLSPTALSSLASFSGEHQVIIQGDRVVLHHQQDPHHVHSNFAKVLAAVSYTNEAGDHVLPCVDGGLYEEPRLSEMAEAAPSLKTVEDSVDSFSHYCPLTIDICEIAMASTPCDEDIIGLTLTHWRTVKIIV